MANTDAVFVSRAEADQAVFLYEFSATVPNGTQEFVGFGGINVSTNLPFQTLPILIWSNTADFAISSEAWDEAYATTQINSFINPALVIGQDYEIIEATQGTLNISRWNTSGSSQTVYFRIVCFAPDDISISIDTPETQLEGNTDNFITRDVNMMKLAYKGYLTPSSLSFNHNLGYVPRVQLWANYFRFVSGIVTPDDTSLDDGVTINETSISWTGTNYARVDFRIYEEQ